MKNSIILGWIGRGVTAVVCIPFLFSAAAKLFPAILYPQMPEQMSRIGLPLSILTPIAILELLSIATYLIPITSVLGAVLLTGYLGGAILTHIRVGENVLMHVILGMVIWFGIYLREPRLRAILPIRRNK